MRAQLLSNQPTMIALIYETGDSVIEALSAFAAQRKINAAHFTAIGAFQDADLGFFDMKIKDYRKISVREQVEVLSLVGDIAIYKGQPKVHAHAVLGHADGSTVGGHLLEAHVRPTLELVLTESPAYLRREFDSETGLPLIRPLQD